MLPQLFEPLVFYSAAQCAEIMFMYLSTYFADKVSLRSSPGWPQTRGSPVSPPHQTCLFCLKPTCLSALVYAFTSCISLMASVLHPALGSMQPLVLPAQLQGPPSSSGPTQLWVPLISGAYQDPGSTQLRGPPLLLPTQDRWLSQSTLSQVLLADIFVL